jgi:hypothetical protein
VRNKRRVKQKGKNKNNRLNPAAGWARTKYDESQALINAWLYRVTGKIIYLAKCA